MTSVAAAAFQKILTYDSIISLRTLPPLEVVLGSYEVY